MELFTLILVVSVMHCCLFFFDSFFKSCMHYPYDAFLRNTGFNVRFFRLQWHTTAFNRAMVRFRHFCPTILSKSFDIGVYVTLMLFPVVVVGLILSVLHTDDSSSAYGDSVRAEVVLPFVTLPIDEVPYYIVALMIIGIVHEFGHAMAASLEDVSTRGFGIHLFFFLPFAYAELDNDQMSCLRIWKRLKILCAGVWHNILVGMVCYLILISVPQLASGFYNINDSVIVTSIKPRSPVASGGKGLHVYDIIKEINGCKVKNLRTWYSCLQETALYQPSYCLTTDFVQQNDESVLVSHNGQIIECCDPKNKKANCFEHIQLHEDEDTEVPQFLCLDIRQSLEHSHGFCNKKRHCRDSLCFKPLLDNSTTLVQFKRWYQDDMIYLGHPADVSRTVKVSEFVPKTTWFSAHVADSINLILRYLIVFSFGYAFINVTPCFGFDGQHLVNAVVHNFTAHDKAKRELICLGLNCTGTLLIFILMTKTVWTSLLSKAI